ncbi:DUF45 domain-containing protein [archaeon]|nr:MAG: DUF45 domain-containing protein [archaeon]
MKRSRACLKSCNKSIELGSEKIDYLVEWRNVRYSRLHFRSGKLLVVLPKHLDSELSLLHKKQDWIVKKHAKIHNILKIAYDNAKENRIPILGQDFSIIPSEKFFFDPVQKIIRADLQNIRHRNKLLRSLKSLLADEIYSILNKYDDLTKSKKFEVMIRVQRTRWASYAPNGKLCFNLKMAFLSKEMMEYIVFHELTHIKERHHNGMFWKEVEERYPNFKEHEKELFNNWFLAQRYLEILSYE